MLYHQKNAAMGDKLTPNHFMEQNAYDNLTEGQQKLICQMRMDDYKVMLYQ